MKNILVFALLSMSLSVLGQTMSKEEFRKKNEVFFQTLQVALDLASGKIGALNEIKDRQIKNTENSFNVIDQCLSYSKNTKFINNPHANDGAAVLKITVPGQKGIIVYIGISNSFFRTETTKIIQLTDRKQGDIRLYYYVKAYDKEEEEAVIKVIERQIAQFLESLKGLKISGISENPIDISIQDSAIKLPNRKLPLTQELRDALQSPSDTQEKTDEENTNETPEKSASEAIKKLPEKASPESFKRVLEIVREDIPSIPETTPKP